MNHNLFSRLREGFPEEEATLIERADSSKISYADVVAMSGRLANALVGFGLCPGDRVAVQVDKSAESLLLYLATVRAGCIYLPLNTAYPVGEVRYFLTDAAPRLFICRPADLEAMRQLASEVGVPQVETLGALGDGTLASFLSEGSEEFTDVARDVDDLAAILYTSGTTGRSKGAMLSHGNLFSNSQTLREVWRFTRDDRLLHALPIFHTHGLFVATNVTLSAGGSMILLPSFDPDAILRLLPRATTMMGVPTFYTRLLARPELTRELVAGIRLFVSGSAPLSAETHREWEERTGHQILERYGMTETNMNTSNPYDGRRVPGSVGPALPGIDVRIADPDTGAPLAQGEVGSIEISGSNVFKGYWNMPEKTAAEFRSDGYFISGDLGVMDPEGYISIVGRAKDLIIAGGFNIYPAEVENVIETVPGVAECAVIGVPHADLGEAVVALIVPRPGAMIDETIVQSAVNDELARYKQPRRIIVVDDLPRNAMGKVQKKELREIYAGIFA
jgi:malonyl-CoA/methylmalonyl-CoA synthetase